MAETYVNKSEGTSLSHLLRQIYLMISTHIVNFLRTRKRKVLSAHTFIHDSSTLMLGLHCCEDTL